MKLTTTIDVTLGRGGNDREHYKTTARRKDKEKKATAAALPTTLWDGSTMASHMTEDRGARITVIRPHSPSASPMDSDNLSASFKYPRDEIARFLGVDDGSPRLHFIYQQCVAPKLGMSVKKGRTKASPDYDTRPTITIEVLPVGDIDPHVKRVRELEAQLDRWVSFGVVSLGVPEEHDIVTSTRRLLGMVTT